MKCAGDFFAVPKTRHLRVIAKMLLICETAKMSRLRSFEFFPVYFSKFPLRAQTKTNAALGRNGVCPVVKRIWTPSWVLFSGGWCCVLMAGFYVVIDLLNFKHWSFPLVVIGLKSIAAYLIAHLFDGFIFKALKTHFGKNVFKMFGDPYEPLLLGAAVLGVYWLLLFWMYRRKIFLRI